MLNLVTGTEFGQVLAGNIMKWKGSKNGRKLFSDRKSSGKRNS